MSSGRIESFDELPLSFALLRGIGSVGWHSPSEYQKQEMKKILTSKCLLTVARSGYGKTSALAIAALHEVLIEGPEIQSLILVDTREHAKGVWGLFNSIATHMKGKLPRINDADTSSPAQLHIETIVGGVLLRDTMTLVKKLKPQLLVGTPGRILDMVKRGCITFENLKFFAINGAQDCLAKGFCDQLQELVKMVPTHARKIVTNYCQFYGSALPEFNSIFPTIENSNFEDRPSKTDGQVIPTDQLVLGVDFVDFEDLADLAAGLVSRMHISEVGVSAPSAVQTLSTIRALQRHFEWPVIVESTIVSLKAPHSATVRKCLLVFDPSNKTSVSESKNPEVRVVLQVRTKKTQNPAAGPPFKPTNKPELRDAREYLRCTRTQTDACVDD